MSRIPRHLIDEVRDRTDLAEVVQRFVALTRRGSSYVGLCPFHQEKTPSFHVVPHKHLFHCFGCQTGGDVFKFLGLMEGLSFVEAVKELAGPAGVTIEERELTADERRQLRRRATIYDVLEEVTRFYESVLWTRPEGAPGRQFMEERGLDQETSREARLGYAPGGWTTLLDHMHGQGFPEQLVVEVGLARQRAQASGHYDFLRERIIFPIRDERGRVIAFGGRIVTGDGPKYLNTPESTVYQKSKVLYGLDLARPAIQRVDRALVVEGYMDVLSLRQAGFPESIATCGTALTTEHMRRIRHLTRDVVALFDSDEAGAQAAERSLPLFLDAGIQAWRLDLGGAKDPDDLVREGGPEAMERALANRAPLLEWLVQRRLETHGTHAGSQSQLIETLLPLLAGLSPVMVSGVAATLKVNEAALLQRLQHHVRRGPDGPPPPPRDGWQPSREMVHLSWLLVHRYEDVAGLVARADPDLFDPHPEVRGMLARLVAGEPAAAILPELQDDGIARTLSAVVAREKLYEPDEAVLATCHILHGLGRPRREATLAQLTRQAEEARRDGDLGRVRATLAQRAALVTLQGALQSALVHEHVAEFMHLMTGDPGEE
ncbi:MAG: DNA primase [Deltaproteobacteria bacterium]|nr:DNA primase [Deltaproteobacteria bacterium]MBW2253074.1 DNA primase [Deltaproteobacteria bacterium]